MAAALVCGLLIVPIVGAGTLIAAGTAGASSHNTVCANGCAFTSIQAAINAASPGATITIGAGKYYENVVVSKSVTLQGSGNGTVLYPAVSAPNPSGCVGSLCAGASNMILVQADNVTITNLRLEGDNPNLTSGVVAGGADIDARNGIIVDFNYAPGIFNNLTVSYVNVSDIYLRGIYASSGGTFNFNHDTVNNVQADPSSVAMFNFGGSGVMSDNTVTNASDAISANWSMGTQFLNNDVSKSGSGIHTDNNGGFGGVADLIQGTTVRDCTVGGYGIFVFAPYVSATVDSNTVKGCSVGLAAYGSQVSGQGPTFSNNTVQSDGAKTTDPNGTYGAYLTTDLLGYGFANLTVTLTGNSFENFQTGMFVTQTTGGQATVTASPNNSFHNNGTGANGGPGTVVNAQNNWWGCKKGPNMGGGCDTATGTVVYTPWLTSHP
jgi:hypothetical protein